MDEAQLENIVRFQNIVEQAMVDAVGEACVAVWGSECKATRRDIEEAYGDLLLGDEVCESLFGE